MNYLRHNSIFAQSIIVFLLMCSFFAPIFVSWESNAFSPAVSHAQDAKGGDSTWGAAIGSVVLSVGAWFTYWGGMLLEFSLRELVFEMGRDLNGASLKPTIDNMWSLIRDICNLVFIFGFIYIGIHTIIDPERASTKRFLAQIIIGALLINFSLFITKFVIDVSNFTAFQLFKGLSQGGGYISENFAQLMGISTLYKTDPSSLVSLTKLGSFWFYFMGAIMLLVAAFVMAAGGILLIVRYVALILIMMFSPVLFAATVFPQTASLAKGLWQKLFSYSFFAPVYLLLLLVSLAILRGISVGMGVVTVNGGQTTVIKTWSDGLNGSGVDSYAVILNFVIVIMFLIFTLLVAKKIGIVGGDMAVSVGNNLRGKIQGAIGRNSIGWASHKAREGYEKLDARMSKTRAGRFTRAALSVGTLGALSDKSVRGALQTGEHAKFGDKYSYEDDEKYRKERKARQATTNKLEDFKKNVAKSYGTLDEKGKIEFERAVADATVKDLEELEQEQRAKIVGLMTQNQIDGLMKSEKLTDKDKEELGKKRQEHFKNLFQINKEMLTKATSDQLEALGAEYLSEEQHAVRLNSSQMDDLKKKLTPTEFEKLSKAREDALIKLASGEYIHTTEKTGAVTLDASFITKQKPGEISKLPAKVLMQKEIASVLPTTALEKVVRDGTLNKVDQAKVRENIEEVVNDWLRGAYTGMIAPEEERQLEALEKWLTDSPIGKQLGR